MTDIMINMTSSPYKRYEVYRYHYCNHDKYPERKADTSSVIQGGSTAIREDDIYLKKLHAVIDKVQYGYSLYCCIFRIRNVVN
jgi:hypothetical protein